MALKDKWKLTGKNTGKAFSNFGEAGKSFGQAMAGTADKVVNKEEKEETNKD